MTKRSIVVVVAALLTVVLLVPASAQADDAPIYPWLVDEVTVSADEVVVIGARWGACRRGMIHGFHTAVQLDWTLDGTPVFGADSADNELWGPAVPGPLDPSLDCVGGVKKGHIWWTYWEYPLGPLAPGDHEVRLVYWLDHPVIDGVDYDGSGGPDRFDGLVVDATVTIHVLP